jgi:hypothetical protein
MPTRNNGFESAARQANLRQREPLNVTQSQIYQNTQHEKDFLPDPRFFIF